MNLTDPYEICVVAFCGKQEADGEKLGCQHHPFANPGVDFPSPLLPKLNSGQ